MITQLNQYLQKVSTAKNRCSFTSHKHPDSSDTITSVSKHSKEKGITPHYRSEANQRSEQAEFLEFYPARVPFGQTQPEPEVNLQTRFLYPMKPDFLLFQHKYSPIYFRVTIRPRISRSVPEIGLTSLANFVPDFFK